MKIKKVLSVFLSCLIVLVMSPIANGENVKSIDGTYFDVMSLDEAYQDSEVMEYINEYYAQNPMMLQEHAELGYDYMGELVEHLNISLIESDMDTITREELDAINQEYGMEEAAEKYAKRLVISDSDMLVLRDEKSNSPINVWTITYYTTQKSFQIKIAEYGEPLDRISGGVYLYGYSGNTWLHSYLDYDNFVETNVTSGTLYTWNIPADYVKEKFEYSLTVVDNGTYTSYDNQGDDDQYRYNFVVGGYSSIQARGGDRHHFVSKKALSSYGYNTNTATCIRMIRADHYKTGSYGSTSHIAQEEQYLANEQYKDLIAYEIDDFRIKGDSENIYASLYDKYYDAIVLCVIAYSDLFGVVY